MTNKLTKDDVERMLDTYKNDPGAKFLNREKTVLLLETLLEAWDRLNEWAGVAATYTSQGDRNDTT